MKHNYLKSLFLMLMMCVGMSAWAEGWTRCTAVSDLTSGGTFIIGYEATANSGKIIPMKNTGGTATTSTAGYMASGSEIDMETVTTTTDYEVSIVASTTVTGAICIKVGDNFIGNTNTKNNLKLFTEEATTTSFGVTVGTNDVFTLKIAGNDSYHTLQYNTASPRFAVYGGAQKNLVIYKKSLETPGLTKYAINVPTNVEGGSISANLTSASEGATVILTAKPNNGYKFREWKVTNYSTGEPIEVKDNRFTMPAAVVQVNAIFKQIVSHTAYFSVNGIVTSSDTFEEDDDIEFPSDIADICGKKFQGWTTTANYSNATTAPSDLCKSATMGSENVTYYAVFATQTGSGSDALSKIIDTNQVEEGTYAIISYNEKYYLSNAKATSSPNLTAVTKVGDDITIADNMKWTLTIDNNGKYILKSNASTAEEQLYLWGAPTNDGIRIVTSSQKSNPFNTWELKSTNDYGLVLCHNISGTTYRYLATYSTQDWRNYENTNSPVANLYKVVPGVSYSDYSTTVPTSTTITISSACYSTFYDSSHAYVMPDDCEGYVFTKAKGLELAYEAEDVVPAGEPLVIYTIEPGTKTLNYTTSTDDTWKSINMNDLEGTDVATALEADDNYYFYGLSKGKTDTEYDGKVGFFWMAEGGAAFTNGAHKAYLKLPKTQSSAKAFAFDDVETLILEINAETTANKQVYDLQGRKVTTAKKGLYIINGKKVIK